MAEPSLQIGRSQNSVDSTRSGSLTPVLSPDGMEFIYLREKERNMEQLELLGEFLSGVGVLLLGCAALWFVTVYEDKKK